MALQTASEMLAVLLMMTRKIFRGGTPYEWAVMIYEFNSLLMSKVHKDRLLKRVKDGKWVFRDKNKILNNPWIEPDMYELQPDDALIVVSFGSRENDLSSIIRIHKSPNNSITLSTSTGDKNSDLEKMYQVIENEMIAQGWVEVGEGETSGDGDNENREIISEDIYVPKNNKSFRDWQAYYEIIKVTRKVYKQRWDNFEADSPDVKMDDFRDAISSDMGKKPSEKTIRRVIKAGDAGKLD